MVGNNKTLLGLSAQECQQTKKYEGAR